jgi:hypothetical protein
MRIIAIKNAWKGIRWFMAVVLLLAAGLETYQLVIEPTFDKNLFSAWWFNVFVVEFEIFFVFWLIFGLLPKLTWVADVSLFSIFAMVSCYKAISGETSCGCFGSVTVNPWLTMVFDLGMIGLLWKFQPVCATLNFQSIIDEFLKSFRLRKLILVVLVWFIIIIPITYAIFSVNKTDFGNLGVEFVGLDGKKVLLLTPEKWNNKKFPLIPYIEKSEMIERLKNGQWTVVLFSHQCEKCKNIGRIYCEKSSQRFVY